MKEGSLDAPTRHPLDWTSPEFYDENKIFAELERVYGICHGCRRCVNLCTAFPTLFDLIDEGPTGELDGVAKDRYWDVVDRCYLCDMPRSPTTICSTLNSARRRRTCGGTV